MTRSDFEWRNEIERSLSDAQSGRLSLLAFLHELMNAELFVPSAAEVGADGSGFQPLIYQRDQGSYIAAFTERNRISESEFPVKYCLAMKGHQMFEWIGKEYGVVINPGYSVGMEIPAKGVKEIWQDFGAGKLS